MKIYLASRYSRRQELVAVRDFIQRLGFVVTSRWLDTAWTSRPGGSSAAPPEYRDKYALIDLEDVAEADIVVSFTEPPEQAGGRGGRHVEFGYGLALNKLMIVVGPRENLFHEHSEVVVVEDTTLLYDVLKRLSAKLVEAGAWAMIGVPNPKESS